MPPLPDFLGNSMLVVVSWLGPVVTKRAVCKLRRRCYAEDNSLAGICLPADSALEGTLFGVAANMAAQVLDFGKRALANVAVSLAVDLHVRIAQLRHGMAPR